MKNVGVKEIIMIKNNQLHIYNLLKKNLIKTNHIEINIFTFKEFDKIKIISFRE
jgi:hypothetical protein